MNQELKQPSLFNEEELKNTSNENYHSKKQDYNSIMEKRLAKKYGIKNPSKNKKSDTI